MNNGPYRALNDPDNAVFLRTLASGRVPAELAPPSSPGSPSTGPVDVKLEDKRDQEYVPPDYVAFSGGGNSLVAEGGEEVEAVGASEGERARRRKGVQVKIAAKRRVKRRMFLRRDNPQRLDLYDMRL